MKPWVMWTAALAGVLISLTVRAFVDRAAAPPVPRHAEVATGFSPIINVMPEPAEMARIGEEKPLLYLETGQGDRVIVGAYQVEGEWLSLSDVRDLEPVQYVGLVAVYADRQERYMPVIVDLRMHP